MTAALINEWEYEEGSLGNLTMLKQAQLTSELTKKYRHVVGTTTNDRQSVLIVQEKRNG